MKNLFTWVVFVFSLQASGARQPYDLILARGRVIDGSGKPAFVADVGVVGDRIAKIGDLSAARAKRRVNAAGLVVAPGFIDMLGQSEINLLVDPRAMSKVMMGVTTEITGEGDTVSPTTPQQVKENADYYAKYHVDVNWHRLSEYLQRLEGQGMGVNLGTYVGAASVREAVVGFENRTPSEAELARMRELVARDMQDGAMGLSTALEYVPGRFAKTSELVELAKVAHQYGGIYATHQRSEADALDESLTEVETIAREAHIPVEIFHLKTSYQQNFGKMGWILDRLAKDRKAGLDILADLYPYEAACTGLSACLPPWALEGGNAAALKRLADPKIRARLKEEIGKSTKEWENIFLGSGGAAGVLISSVVNPELEKYQGKRVSEIAAEQHKDPYDALFDFLIADRMQTEAIYFCMGEKDVALAVSSPLTSFCTDSGAVATDGALSHTKPHPRGAGTFPRVLAKYVREQKLLTLEQAVHKMTGLPAERMGLKGRGLLREGMYADVTVFDPAKISDRATFTNPNQYPEGISYVLVNGRLEVDGGKRTAALAGKVLRGPGYHKPQG